MVETFTGLALGFQVATTTSALFYCAMGVTIGTMVGVLPGLGGMATIAMLMPISYHLEPMSAIIMLAGIYYGAAYGGSTSSILLNLPGTASAAVTCLDGYPMSQQGRGGVALVMTAVASFIGAMLGLVVLIVFGPQLAFLAFRFGSAEYFSLMTLGLVAAALLTTGAPFRGLSMVVLGLIFGLVGTDVATGAQRFTFGSIRLSDGLNLVALAMGLFGVPEIVRNASKSRAAIVEASEISWRSMVPSSEDLRRSTLPILRGGGIGGFLGALPGTGGLLASFMSYAAEKRIHKRPEEFGKGAIEGVAGPEAANNAAIQTAFIPTLTLGIPGDAVMAFMLAVFIMHGIVPGPSLVSQQPELFWGICVSFFIGNLFLLILNIPLVRIWILLVSVPYSILFPVVIILMCIGVYSINNSIYDIYWLMIFGGIGCVLYMFKFEAAPLILGFILGPMMEEHFRRAMLLARGDPTIFLSRPISAVFLLTTVTIISWIIGKYILRKMISGKKVLDH